MHFLCSNKKYLKTKLVCVWKLQWQDRRKTKFLPSDPQKVLKKRIKLLKTVFEIQISSICELILSISKILVTHNKLLKLNKI